VLKYIEAGPRSGFYPSNELTYRRLSQKGRGKNHGEIGEEIYYTGRWGGGSGSHKRLTLGTLSSGKTARRKKKLKDEGGERTRGGG